VKQVMDGNHLEGSADTYIFSLGPPSGRRPERVLASMVAGFDAALEFEIH